MIISPEGDMKRESTGQRIVKEAVKLFAKEGYEAVSVEQIAAQVGIKAPSLYKHFKSKRDIFDHILQIMEQQDREQAQAQACCVPTETADKEPEAYENAGVTELIAFSRQQFRYWTEDPCASAFRKMLTVEQYRTEEMNGLYQQYFGS